MKNKFLTLSLLCIPAAALADDSYSHTYFSARSQFQSAMPEKETMFRNERMESAKGGHASALQAVGYYSQSTESQDLAKFFFPFGKSCLHVSESNPLSDAVAGKDIEARNFNILTTTENFSSDITVAPKQKVIGIGLDYLQCLWRKESGRPWFWFGASFPIERIQNSMNLKERVINADGGAQANTLGLNNAPVVANMTQALKQKSWNYGKIDNCTRTQWGVADIELKLGYNSVHGECCDLSGYFGALVPTGTKVNKEVAEWVFTPVVGNNHHWGIIWGSHMGFDLWESGHHMIRMEHDLASRFLFQNCQVRSFDLVDKQWSRYISVYANETEAALAETDMNPNAGTAGINIFTQKVKVDPRFSFDMNSGFIYTYKKFEAEFGWNFYARQSEKVTLCNWNATPQIKNIDGEPLVRLPAQGDTNIARTMKYNFPGSAIAPADYKAIKKSDLNLDSAAHPAVLSTIVYGSLGYKFGRECWPMFAGLGGSYEFSTVNTSINRWTVFGKLGVSF